MSWVEERDYTKQCEKCGLCFVSVKHFRAHVVEHEALHDWSCISASDLRKSGWKTQEINDVAHFYDPKQTMRAERERLQREQELEQERWEWEKAEAARKQHEEEVRQAQLQEVKVVVDEEEFIWY